MIQPSFAKKLASYAFPAMLATAILIVLVKAYAIGQGLEQRFAEMGSDDILRLTMVRDLIAGQSWFDQMQYRLVPPEGVSVHWSRYIDAGLAAIIIPLSWFLPMTTAEQVAVMVWPTLVLILTLVAVGFGTRRVFGATAACFAVACVIFWPLTADLHTRPGNIDHHNIQFLTMVIVLLGVIWPDRPARAGAVAGVAAAFSLAVGLENLVFIVVAGAVLLVRAAFDRAKHFARLRWFCAALLIGAVLFWIGQASTVYRFRLICDQLGLPVLTLIGLAAAAGLLPFALLKGNRQPWLFVGGAAVLTAGGLVLAMPVVGVCFAGPYGALPDFIQAFIRDSIIEAKPILVYAQSRPVATLTFVLPVLAAFVLGLWLAITGRASPVLTPERRAAVVILTVFCAVGLGMLFYQMRTVNLAATPVPFLAGAIMSVLLTSYLAERSAGAAAKLLLAAFVLVVPTVSVTAVAPLLPETKTSGTGGSACRSYDAIQSLNAVPPAVILASGNFGALIVWGTHHSALAAPYHRSAASMANSILPFCAADDEVEAEVRATGADLLMLCKGQVLGSAFLNQMSEGGTADWLRPIPVDHESVLLFEILP